MTITKNSWNEFLSKFWDCMKVYVKANSKKANKEIINEDQIKLFCDDALAKLRNTGIAQYYDQDSGSLRKVTCKKFFESFFAHYLKLLHNTAIEVVVFSMDPYDNRRDEKYATSLSRIRKPKEGVPEFLTMPRGQDYFFLDNNEMPGTMDLIFTTPQAKAELYEYITEYLKSEQFKKDVPEGKSFIFSGALKINRVEGKPFHNSDVVRLPPLVVTKSSYRFMDEITSDHISEGDVDVWRWPVKIFPTLSFLIDSNDCDVLLIGLLQMRHIITESSDRRGWFVTRRSVGTAEQSPESLQQKESMKVMKTIAYVTTLEATGSIDEAYRASGGLVPPASLLSFPQTSSPSVITPIVDDPNPAAFPSDEPFGETRKRTRSPEWGEHYVDMFKLYSKIIREAFTLVEKHCLPLANPVETYVMCLCLASDKHDYILTKLVSKKIGSYYLWTALRPNLWKIGDMVRVYRSQSPSSSSSSSSDQDRFHYYVVDTQALKRLVQCAYIQKAHESLGPSKKNNTEEKLEKARQLKGEQMFKDNITDDDIQLVAAQCVWVLQYWGNGVFSNYEIVNGLLIDENQKSVYGFNKDGWAPCVSHTELKIAPPLPDEIQIVPEE